jgi:hypothetical protein
MSKIDEKVDELRAIIPDLGDIELKTMEYTLADAIREGSMVTKQAIGGFGDGHEACAMSAAVIAAAARGYIKV